MFKESGHHMNIAVLLNIKGKSWLMSVECRSESSNITKTPYTQSEQWYTPLVEVNQAMHFL